MGAWPSVTTKARLHYYGSGGDGAVSISANTTLTKAKHCTTLTVTNNSVLTTDGYQVFATLKVQVDSGSTIRNSGVGTAGGDKAYPANTSSGTLRSTTTNDPVRFSGGGAGGNSSGTTEGGMANDRAVGLGGNGGAGSLTGGGTTLGAARLMFDSVAGTDQVFVGADIFDRTHLNWYDLIHDGYLVVATVGQDSKYDAGGGGGGGGGNGIGGGGGGVVWIATPSITNNGAIESKGGDAAGTNAGGGGGGVIVLIYRSASTKTGSGTYSVVGGAKLGTGAAGGRGIIVEWKEY